MNFSIEKYLFFQLKVTVSPVSLFEAKTQYFSQMALDYSSSIRIYFQD